MKKFNILCIDDQRDVLAAIQKDLAFFEPIADIHECESAPEAEELLEELYVNEAPVVLIICDHIMPDENGVDFLSRLKKDDRYASIRSILLTGLATHDDTIEAINRAQVSHYIEKPWDSAELLQQVKILLTGYLLERGEDYHDYMEFLDQATLLKELRHRV